MPYHSKIVTLTALSSSLREHEWYFPFLLLFLVNNQTIDVANDGIRIESYVILYFLCHCLRNHCRLIP